MTTILPPTNLDACRKVREGMESHAFLNVWEGAVRSGKTVFALMAFANYVINSKEKSFLLSGRTVKTIEKNAILDEYGLLNLIPGARYRKVGEARAITLRSHGIDKVINVVGASDIRAYMQIRGNTYAGWFADEINMHDPEFVSEALRRTAMSRDRRHYWTLNPDNPYHWVYEDYLNRYAEMTPEELDRLGGYRWWHFTPKDNPAMTPAMIQSLEMQYPKGTYLYDRYILGERCMAEGLIYPKVNASYFRDFDVSDVDIRYCAIDFGTDHPTVMVFGGMVKGNRSDWRIVAEYYDEKSDKTTYDYYVDFLDMCRNLGADPNRITVAIDPAANVLRLEFVNHGLNVVRAKNDVLPGIDFTRRAIYDGILSFHASMKKALKQFGSYSWDPKASERGEDKPIKIKDDIMDAIRYFSFTFVRPMVKW